MTTRSPKDEGFKQPAEWEPQEGVWLAWPWDETLWEKDLAGAQSAVFQFAASLHQGNTPIHMLIPPGYDRAKIRSPEEIPSPPLHFFEVPYGDIWLRDIGPIFVRQEEKRLLAAAIFQFNGWGEKYILKCDAEVAARIAEALQIRKFISPLVLEGGALETNGAGLAITTEQCLLNPNRNPGLKPFEIEKELSDYLGVEKVIWLKQGLRNDHTDGHVDNLARFADADTVLCMKAAGASDPNEAVLNEIRAALGRERSTSGGRLQIIELPSPGPIQDQDGKLLAASYLNFFISNDAVCVPQFGVENDMKALKILEGLYPRKKIFGIYCKILLTGGGTLHCISQQQPKA